MYDVFAVVIGMRVMHCMTSCDGISLITPSPIDG